MEYEQKRNNSITKRCLTTYLSLSLSLSPSLLLVLKRCESVLPPQLVAAKQLGECRPPHMWVQNQVAMDILMQKSLVLHCHQTSYSDVSK